MERKRPKVIVFDLDMCMWAPEMYELSGPPKEEIRGDLAGKGEGCVGCKVNGSSQVVRLFPGALEVLQMLHTDPEWKDVKVAAASSSEVPEYSDMCLRSLEILPSVKMRSVFSFFAIGRRGELSSDKRTHMAKIQRESGIEPKDYLFFDDCNWGDHVGKLASQLGIVGVRTPSGLTRDQFFQGLRLFQEQTS
eukprot:g982.t1